MVGEDGTKVMRNQRQDFSRGNKIKVCSFNKGLFDTNMVPILVGQQCYKRTDETHISSTNRHYYKMT